MVLKNLFTGQQWRNGHREQTHGPEERAGEGERHGKRLRTLKQGLCINLEGWDGEGDGREVQKEGEICIPMAASC